MSYYSDRNYFKGKIDGKSAQNLRFLDTKLENSNERLQFVNEKIEECNELLTNYVDKYYKCNTTGELSQDINIFQNLELLGTYLLNSKDLATEKNQEYKIYTDEELFFKHCKENGEDFDSVMPFLKTNTRNELIVESISIKEEDFLHPELGPVLKDYKKMHDFLKNELIKAKNGEKMTVSLKKAKSLIAPIKDDMILSKEKIIRPIELNMSGDYSAIYDWDKFDFKNKSHIKAMLYCPKTNLSPDDDVSLIAYEINKAIKNLYKTLKKFDKVDLEILYFIRKGKSYTQDEIGYELGISKQAISKRIDKMADRLVKYFETNNYF